jgi:hypothetical protein
MYNLTAIIPVDLIVIPRPMITVEGRRWKIENYQAFPISQEEIYLILTWRIMCDATAIIPVILIVITRRMSAGEGTRLKIEDYLATPIRQIEQIPRVLVWRAMRKVTTT